MADSFDMTAHLEAAVQGSPGAVDRLVPCVYEELRAYVTRRLGGRGGTVQPTEIVHEVYLKLVDQARATYANRLQFFVVAAQAVRRVLVDPARRAAAAKRGGDRHRTTLDSRALGTSSSAIDLLDLHEALAAVGREEPRCARLVDLRFFAGLTGAEAARELGISTATAERDWRFARAFLHNELEAPRGRHGEAHSA
jgi:RNA polymerase sigma factor (TIGR02999 family)